MPETLRLALVRQVLLTEIMDLRYRVLRPGLPLEEARFPGDELATTWHVGAFLSEEEGVPPACCASFMLNRFQNKVAWQLRGMATEPKQQRLGLGKAVLDWAEREIAQQSGIRTLWCNARVSAAPFYEKLGWQFKSGEFEIPTAGSHREMAKVVRAA